MLQVSVFAEEQARDDGAEQTEGANRLPTVQFGSFTFDSGRHDLRRNGHRVSITNSQMRLLSLFLERRDELVTRDEIAARLWTETGTIDVEAGINTAVNRLRRSLQEAPGAASAIETVVGLGYRFTPELTRAGRLGGPATQTGLAAEDARNAPPVAIPEAPPVSSDDAALRGLPPAVLLRQEPEAAGAARSPALPAPSWRKWLTPAALSLVGLILLTAWSFWAMRRSAKPAGGVPETPATKLAPLLQLTPEYEVGKLTAAAVSPSGKLLAYADSYGISVYSFATLQTHLQVPRPAFTVDRLSWAPDERSLLMSGTDQSLHQQQVWYVLIGGYAGLVLADASRAVLSPDGSTVVFTRAGDREVWQAAASGQQPRLLRKAAPGERFDLVLWSPAGNRLLATVKREHPTATGGAEAESGSVAAYEYLDATTGHLLHRQEGFAAVSGYLLRNGSFFFIDGTRSGSNPSMASIMMAPLDLASGKLLGTPRRVRDLEAEQADSISASLTGARTAALLQRNDVDAFVADLDNPGPKLSHVTRLTQELQQVFPHSWTADGKAILVEGDPSATSADRPTRSIYRQPVDGARPTLLASLTGAASMAQLSPDGRWILFLELSRPTHGTGIFRVPVNGGTIEQVSTTGSIEEFRCSNSSAGRCVVREALGKEAFVYYALDPVKGMGEQLSRTAWQPSLFGDWGLSADGSMVAVASHDALHPHVSLFRLGNKDLPAQEIALQGHGVVFAASWRPDGKSLFVECHTNSGYELVSLDLNGRARVLRTSPMQIWAVPSRDGRQIAFPGVTISSSLWTSSEQQ